MGAVKGVGRRADDRERRFESLLVPDLNDEDLEREHCGVVVRLKLYILATPAVPPCNWYMGPVLEGCLFL